jgi:hypothetical protein
VDVQERRLAYAFISAKSSTTGEQLGSLSRSESDRSLMAHLTSLASRSRYVIQRCLEEDDSEASADYFKQRRIVVEGGIRGVVEHRGRAGMQHAEGSDSTIGRRCVRTSTP